jgi:hypothetical protein
MSEPRTVEEAEKQQLRRDQDEAYRTWRCPTCGSPDSPPESDAAKARARWRVGEFDPNAQIVNQLVDIAEKLEHELAVKKGEVEKLREALEMLVQRVELHLTRGDVRGLDEQDREGRAVRQARAALRRHR